MGIPLGERMKGSACLPRALSRIPGGHLDLLTTASVHHAFGGDAEGCTRDAPQ